MWLRVYQIVMAKDTRQLKFKPLEDMQRLSGRVTPGIYRKAYDGEFDCDSLESLPDAFLAHPPAACTAGPIMVSDIVSLSASEKEPWPFYFVDAQGFKAVPFDPSEVETRHEVRAVVLEPGREPYAARIPKALLTSRQSERIDITASEKGYIVHYQYGKEAQILTAYDPRYGEVSLTSAQEIYCRQNGESMFQQEPEDAMDCFEPVMSY